MTKLTQLIRKQDCKSRQQSFGFKALKLYACILVCCLKPSWMQTKIQIHGQLNKKILEWRKLFLQNRK